MVCVLRIALLTRWGYVGPNVATVGEVILRPRFFLICLLASLPLAGCSAPRSKPDLSLFLENGKAAVFIFLAADCPLSENYTLTLNELAAEFKGRGIRFYGLVA